MVEAPPEIHHLLGLCGTDQDLMKKIGEFFGSVSTQSDLTLYSRHEGEHVYCVTQPSGYPQKVKSLVQTLRLTDVHILCISSSEHAGPLMGEIIVALDLMHQTRNTRVCMVIGSITPKTEYNVPVLKDALGQILAGTTLKEIPVFILDSNESWKKFKQFIDALPPLPPTQDFTKVLVESSFPVKGIGTVILGLVESGSVKAGEMLELVPEKKKVIVRSIQKQDRNFKTAEAGDHVGLAIKGISPDEIGRDQVLSSYGKMLVSSQLGAKCTLSPYVKTKLSPDLKTQFHLSVGLATIPVKITEGDTIEPGQSGKLVLELAKPLAVNPAGCFGFLLYLEKFTGTLRVVASVHVTVNED